MLRQDCVIFVEPNQGIRNALSHAIRAEKIVAKAIPYNSLLQVLFELRAGQRADVVFISNHFAHEDVLEFVSAAKNTIGARDAAFVLLTDQSRQRVQALARQVLMGMDGFLSFPFNIETVQTTIKIALDVRSQRMVRRIELASKMVLGDFAKKLDHLAYDGSERGGDLALSPEIKQLTNLIQALWKEDSDVYYNTLIRVFENASPRVRFLATQDLQSAITESSNSGLDQINKILTRLKDESRFIRLRALLQAESCGKRMLPYIEEIRKLENDSEPTCYRLAQRIVETLERQLQVSRSTQIANAVPKRSGQ